MTRAPDPSDVDLAARIRRSMQHYRFSRSLTEVEHRGERRMAGWQRFGLAVAAGTAAVAITVAVLSLVSPRSGPPTGGPDPSASPATPPPADAIVRACLDGVAEVPPDQRLPGEDAATALARVRALPLLIAHPEAGHYLLADDFAWLACVADGGTPVRRVSGLRTDPPRILELRAWVGAGTGAGQLLAAGTLAEPASSVEVTLANGTTFNADVEDGYWLASWQGAAATGVRALSFEGMLVAQLPVPGAPGSPVPSASPVPEDVAATLCLPVTADDVLADWVEEGEDAASVAARLSGLPLAIAEHRSDGSAFVFADDRFVVACRFEPGADTPGTHMRGVRDPGADGAAGLLFVSSRPQTVDDEGEPVPGERPETLAIGAAEAEVDRVALVLEDGSELEAKLAGGVWLAWWREPLASTALRAYGVDDDLLDEVAAEIEIYEFPEDGIVEEEAASTSAAE
jgi:hypothetical protein